MRNWINLIEDAVEQRKVTNPALMTFQEYYGIVNKTDKFHCEDAYDVDLKKLNGYSADKSKFPKLLRRFKVKGIEFELRDNNESSKFEHMIGIFHDDMKVGSLQDEWGCVLIMVAREYRSFGLGTLLSKLAHTLYPEKTSGGFTPSGLKTFVKAYREIVRDALKSGLYRRLVLSGELTVDRVREIIQSAQLGIRQKVSDQNLNSDNPEDWMLYVGEYGDFVLYDRKLRNIIRDSGTEVSDHWIETMVKGVMLVRHLEHRNDTGIVVRFGGDTDRIKTFLMTCAITHCVNEGTPFEVDPEDRQFVDARYGRVAETPDMKTGQKRYLVTPVSSLDLTPFRLLERSFRATFDEYDEFHDHMLEIAFSKFRTVD